MFVKPTGSGYQLGGMGRFGAGANPLILADWIGGNAVAAIATFDKFVESWGGILPFPLSPLLPTGILPLSTNWTRLKRIDLRAKVSPGCPLNAIGG